MAPSDDEAADEARRRERSETTEAAMNRGTNHIDGDVFGVARGGAPATAATAATAAPAATAIAATRRGAMMRRGFGAERHHRASLALAESRAGFPTRPSGRRASHGHLDRA